MRDDVLRLRRDLLEQLGADRPDDELLGQGAAVAMRRSATCGDQVELAASVREGTVEEVAWRGRGCRVSTASAAILERAALGMPAARVTEALAVIERVLAKAPDGAVEHELEALRAMGARDVEDVEALAGLARLPLRAGCALLAWRTLADALRA